VLLENGEICETDCQCVSGLCAEPRPPDAGGQFPKRCLDTAAGGECKVSGDTCFDPGQCCDGLCLPAADACGFTCGGGGSGGAPGVGGSPGEGGTGNVGDPGCVDFGGNCTTDSDCCVDYACAPNGASGLVCLPIIR
jgi:hypothetical protein